MNMINLVIALIAVESAGNPNAVGDDGRALGCLQIHKCVVQDVNRIYKTKYKHKDAKDPKIAFAMCMAYLRYWGYRYQVKTGKRPTMEVYARIWNGGPKGWEKNATVSYWKKVKSKMEEK